MYLLTTCFILATAAVVPNGTSLANMQDPQADEVYVCDFETPFDRNYDGWPDGWTRRRGREFPDYVKVGIIALENEPRQHALSIELDGGAASVSCPSIPISTRYSFIVEAKVRTDKLKHDAASLSLAMLDEEGNTLETHESPPVYQATDWQWVRIGPIAPHDPKVRSAVISLQLLPRGEEEDLVGSALFDELRLLRVPRMSLRTNNDNNLFYDLRIAEIVCDVSGIAEASPEMTFELYDRNDRLLASQKVNVTAGAGPQGRAVRRAAGSTKEAEPFAGRASWRPPLPDYGFYRVRVSLPTAKGAVLQRMITLAALRTLPSPTTGEFGWSLPHGEQPLPLDKLGMLLGNVGINWAKFPVWPRENDPAWPDRIAWFAERLSLQSIEMVGLLERPPVQTNGLVDREQSAVASVFMEPDVWQPLIDPFMTRLSLKVRWWQLGNDRDMSFVGLAEAADRVSEIKRRIEHHGQEIRLGIVWNWMNQPPTGSQVPWDFLSLAADPSLTAEELAVYLQGTTPPPPKPSPAPLTHGDMFTALQPTAPPAPTMLVETGGDLEDQLRDDISPPRARPSDKERPPKVPYSERQWVTLEPLPRDEYSRETRVRDLVMRMLSAKINGASAIFIPNPFDSRCGLLNEDGSPGDLLLPWRTTSLLLSGADYLGSVQLPGGSKNHVFGRDGQAVMVVWNDQPTRERMSLGEDLRQIDLWGHETIPDSQEENGQTQHEIEVGPMPTIITGLHEAVARWQIDLTFDTDRLSSIFGRSQPLVFRVPNHFGQAVGGELILRAPKSWDMDPRPVRFRLSDGDELKHTYPVSLLTDANSGPQPLQLDFEISADRTYRFRVYRTLQLGLDGVSIEMTTRLTADDTLVVEQSLTNSTDHPISFQCTLFPPGRRRETKRIIQQGRGRTTNTFNLPNGKELLGQKLRLRAEEIGGARVLNHTITAER